MDFHTSAIRPLHTTMPVLCTITHFVISLYHSIVSVFRKEQNPSKVNQMPLDLEPMMWSTYQARRFDTLKHDSIDQWLLQKRGTGHISLTPPISTHIHPEKFVIEDSYTYSGYTADDEDSDMPPPLEDPFTGELY
ncbi:hypothetical protein B0H14DRAFT_3893763 [Mycena olivaceomarginata]|nr:hypothetical protein B0H14DRAFT_3893763 [Mycena olivaceomarginata]